MRAGRLRPQPEPTSRRPSIQPDQNIMEMSGQSRIPASQDKVWAALNDPAVLKASIPGCQALEKTSDTEMTATVQAKVGPVKATFNGHVTLSNIDPPNGYTITGEGKGGVAGFAKGGADVKLTPDGDGTLLRFSHRGLTVSDGQGFHPGTHAYLDRLEAYLGGEPLPDWGRRYQEVAQTLGTTWTR